MIIQDVLMDIEFERTIDKLRGDVFVDTSTTKEHIIEIERATRTVKYRSRFIVTTMPFKYLQKLLIANIV